MAANDMTQGAGSYIGFGEESTEGTSVTPTVFGAIRSSNLRLVAPRAGIEPMGRPGGNLPAVDDTYVTEERVEGDVVLTGRYDDAVSIMLLKHLFGQVTTGGSGPSSYTRTYDPTRDKPSNPSLTAELIRGTGGSGINRAETFAGVRVGSLQLQLDTAGLALCTWGMLGITSEGLGPATSPTFQTGRTPILHNHATNLTFNGTQFEEVLGVTLTVNKMLARTAAIGRLTSGPMQMEGLLDVMLSVRHRYTVNSQLSAYQNKTQASGSLTFTDGTASDVWSFPNLEIDDHTANPTGPGLMEATTVFRALSTASSGGVQLVRTNSVAT